MTANMHVGDTISIYDLSKDDRFQIGVKECKDPSLVLIYNANGVENYVIVTIISMVEVFE
jgi:hypothetical protein